MKIRDKRIFMTGGAGFIGTALIKELAHDNEIVVYDSLRRNSLARSDVAHHENITVIKGDILNQRKLKNSMQDINCVIHLAAIAGVDTVIQNPTTTMKVNLIGTHNVLEAATQQESVERFVNFSTSEVYGSYAYKLDERDNTSMAAVGEARWTYATSKLAGEHFTYSYFKEFGLPTVTVRPFNIYGPGQVGEGAIHVFALQALRGQTLRIHGDGDQIRSWCYIKDIVSGVLLCIEKKKAIGEVFNLGNPRGTITVLQLAEKIKSFTNSNSKIAFTPRHYIDVELRIPDIEKAKQVLGFNPAISLDEGLIKTIEWYRGS